MTYSIVEWLFFLYLYSFLGWCFESAYVSIGKRRFVNRGFMRGPFLPIYGTGAVMMLVVSAPFRDNLILTYFAGCIGATVLEYLVGTATEALFHVRYWDYSNQKFNFRGQICLSSTIAWGFFTILMTEVIHKPVEGFMYRIPAQLLSILVTILTVAVAADFALSFKAALDMRDVLFKLENAKAEMERLQKRLDVLIAVADDAIEEERQELRMKFRVWKDRAEQLRGAGDYFRRRLLLDNPGMISARFKEGLEELKEAAREHRRR